jgi:hypothetical protein
VKRFTIAVLALGLLLAAMAGLAVSLWTLVLGHLALGSLFYFPGDPPFLDVALLPASGSVVLAFGLLLLCSLQVLRRHWAAPRLMVLSARTLLAASALTTVFCAAGILYRFSPAWAPVRIGIRTYGNSILAASGGDPRHLLSQQEFLLLEQRFLTPPVEVPVRGYGFVRLRMAHGAYPYVGVDFGGGRNAAFHPGTMYCTYSD